MDATSWTAVGAIATGVGSVVSMGTLGFIAVQTRATRTAAEATRDSADVGARSLELAQKANAQTDLLVAEAVRTRIDTQMPRLLLAVEPRTEWPPFVPSGYVGGEPQQHVSDEPFRMPRDGAQRRSVRLRISLQNDSDMTARIRVSDQLYVAREGEKRLELPAELSLKAGDEAIDAYFEVERSIQEWIDIYDERKAGAPGSELTFSVTYISPNDTGAIDEYRIVVGGTIVEPVDNQDAAWRLIPVPNIRDGRIGSIGWSVQPTLRRYYLSRNQGIELPTNGAIQDVTP